VPRRRPPLGSAPSPADEAIVERERVAAGELPERYAEPWGEPFEAAIAPALREGVVILDVGSGRRPTIAPGERPARSRYLGLDVSAEELAAAPAGSYDEVHVADAGTKVPDLVGAVDLIVSWQVLEHVESLAATLANFRSYLRLGGRMVGQLSGRYAAYAVLGRVVPYSVSVRLMQRLMGAEPETKFPTRYDRCYHAALERLLSDWAEHTIIPRYKGGAYFRFSRPLERAYLAYEDWLVRGGRRNLATHYIVVAVR
jgi:SAM-dependent methyltransferase